MDIEFILDQIETTAEPFALCELHGRADLTLSKDPMATLHYILAGEGELVLKGKAPIPLQQGSLILLPAMCPHTLRSFGQVTIPSPACRPAGLEIAHIIQGEKTEGGGQLIAICAHVSLSLRSLHNLIELVRDPIIETVEEDNLLALPVQAILKEIVNPGAM